MAKTVTVQAEVNIPKVPNFFRMTDGQSLPVAAVNDEELRVIGALWTGALIDRAREQRENPSAFNSTGEAEK